MKRNEKKNYIRTIQKAEKIAKDIFEFKGVLGLYSEVYNYEWTYINQKYVMHIISENELIDFYINEAYKVQVILGANEREMGKITHYGKD